MKRKNNITYNIYITYNVLAWSAHKEIGQPEQTQNTCDAAEREHDSSAQSNDGNASIYWSYAHDWKSRNVRGQSL